MIDGELLFGSVILKKIKTRIIHGFGSSSWYVDYYPFIFEIEHNLISYIEDYPLIFEIEHNPASYIEDYPLIFEIEHNHASYIEDKPLIF